MAVQFYAFTCGFLTIPRSLHAAGRGWPHHRARPILPDRAPQGPCTEAGGEFILCSDACYLKNSLEQMHTPGAATDREDALAVFNRLREMQSRGVQIMYGHDPDFWKTVPQAPIQLG
jgi:hypothetical protein